MLTGREDKEDRDMSYLRQEDKTSSSVWEGATDLASIFGWQEGLFSGEEEEVAMSAMPESIYRRMAWDKSVVKTDDAGRRTDFKAT